MRIAGLIAVTALVAACSPSVGRDAQPTPPSVSPPTSSTAATAATPSPAPGAADRPPGASAPIGEVIAWIEAGAPTDPGTHQVAFLEGVTTRLGDDVAFTAPSGTPDDSTQCITDATYNDGALTCLVELDSPAPRPADGEGMWQAGWVAYPGTSAQIGSLHGDPGPFIKGVGPPLAEGQSLTFGDNRCRSDTTGLFCVNYAHRSAVWISADGLVPFGCLQPVTPPPAQTGALFSC